MRADARWALLSYAALGFPTLCMAQDAEVPDGASPGLTEILVTAQKRGVAESAQRVPVAITAFDSATLDTLQVRDLRSLSTAAPNVALEDVGTIPGTANFTIRGFGIVSSIPSVEPSVGLFVDGVYLGMSAGAVIDVFDLESVEVLRGPQGLLFGRNTTGGAVTLRTRRPGDEFQVRGRLAVETGPQYTAGLSVEGPVANNLRAKVALYYSNDQGWFHNDFNDRPFGKRETVFVRPTIVWDISPDIETTLIYEHGRSRGDGTVAQNTAFQSGFQIDIDNPGYFDIDWDALTSETNINVALGNGVITNVAGYRRLNQNGAVDVDGLPISGFHSFVNLRQHQFSEELRYAGTFGPIKATLGLYYFSQNYFYIERRVLSGGAVDRAFGGRIDQDSWGAFSQLSYDIGAGVSLVGGLRYSWERKKADVATFRAPGLCDLDARTCDFDFPSEFPGATGVKSWGSLTPKLGFQYEPGRDLLLYGSWSRGIRSGGFNVKSTAATIPPGPYDMETQDAFELGWKSTFLDRRVRLNAAIFQSTLRDLQRDINIPDPVSGVVQVTSNVGTARVRGVEGELTLAPFRGLTLGGSFGHLNGKYTKLAVDLNGAAPGLGYELDLTRLPKWSFGANATIVQPVGDGAELMLRADYGYRSRVAFTDNNSAYLNQVNDLSASARLSFLDDRFSVGVFGKNLLNRVTQGGNTPLPPSVGGGFFVPINEGRTVGMDINLKI